MGQRSEGCPNLQFACFKQSKTGGVEGPGNKARRQEQQVVEGPGNKARRQEQQVVEGPGNKARRQEHKYTQQHSFFFFFFFPII